MRILQLLMLPIVCVLAASAFALEPRIEKEGPAKHRKKAADAPPVMTLKEFKALQLSVDPLDHAMYLGSDEAHHHIRYVKGFKKKGTVRISRKELVLEETFPLGGKRHPLLTTNEKGDIVFLLTKR